MASDKEILLHILSVNRTKFTVPFGKFRSTLKMLTRGKEQYELDKYQEKKKQKELKQIPLPISELNIGLYNAVVDTGGPIDIKDVLEKVKEKGLVSGDGIKVTSFTIRYGKFKTALTYTSEYGLVGNESLPFVSADFKVKITENGQTKGASFSYYTSGKVRFSCGHVSNLTTQPKKLVKFFSKNYYPIPNNADIDINNVTAEFKVGFPIKTSIVYDMFSDVHVESKFEDYVLLSSYPPQKSAPKKPSKRKTKDPKPQPKHRPPLLYISFSDEFSLVIAKNGLVQVQGTTDLKRAYNVSKKFFEALKDDDFLTISGNADISLKKAKQTKIAQRLNNQMAPNVTRRGTTCPKARCPKPDPFSFGSACEEGYYVKPNPQGHPCCYSIPKSTKYSKNKVEDAYLKAGVRIPNSVRQQFAFNRATVNRPVNIANQNSRLEVRAFVNNKSGFKIDSRQCLRYTKTKLVDIASRLRIPLPSKLTKPILCDLIKKHAPATNNVSAGGRLISGSNKTLRLGKRLCHTYKRDVLVKFVRVLNKNVDTSIMSKDYLCSLIEKLTKKKKKPKSPSVSSSSSTSPPLSSSSSKFKNSEALYNRIEQFGMKPNNSSNNNFNHFMRGPRSRTS
jgi:hypothetical protein